MSKPSEEKPFKGIKFCLVFPPYMESEDLIFLKTVKKNLGKIPPLSLCAVAAILENQGAGVTIIDANASGLSLEDVKLKVARLKPDFFCYTLSTYQFHFTLQWIKELKKIVNVPVIVGGPHARIYPREILSHEAIDFCITGDAEASLSPLVKSLIDRKSPISVPGLCFRDRDLKIKVNSGFPFISDLDSVPFPSRHLLDNSLYYSLLSRHKNFTAMTTSRGCVFKCTFCDNNFLPYRAMSPKRVVDEIEFCQREYGINEFDMFDGIFSIDKKRTRTICDEIKGRKLKVWFSLRERVGAVDLETLRALKSAGCMRIYYGIESGSPEILKNIRKQETLERMKKTVILTKECGIDVFGFFMVGNFGETHKTVELTRKFMFSLPFDYVQVAPIFYPPNTAAFERVVEAMGYDYWREYTLNPDLKADFPIVGTKFTKKEVDVMARKLYLRFYLRPQFLLKFLADLRTLEEFKRGIRAFSNMVKEYLATTEIKGKN